MVGMEKSRRHFSPSPEPARCGFRLSWPACPANGWCHTSAHHRAAQTIIHNMAANGINLPVSSVFTRKLLWLGMEKGVYLSQGGTGKGSWPRFYLD